MKRTLKIAALVASVAVASPALADMQPAENNPNSLYFRLDTGLAKSSDNNTRSGNTKLNSGKSSDLKNSGYFGAGIGYRFDEHFRSDITLGFIPGAKFSHEKTDGVEAKFGKVRTIAAMANIYYDITTVGAFTPYVTGGIGLAQNKIAETTVKDTKTNETYTAKAKSKINPAFQIGAGSSIYLGQGFNIDAGYRFLHAGKFESAKTTLSNSKETFDPIKGTVKDHLFLIGLRKEF